MANFALRIDDTQYAQLRARALSEGRSTNDLILAALASYQGHAVASPPAPPAPPTWPGAMTVRVVPASGGRSQIAPWDILDSERKIHAKQWACGSAACWRTWSYDAFRMARPSSNRITGADKVVTLLMNSRLEFTEMDALTAKAGEIEAALADLPDQPLASADLAELAPKLRRIFKLCRGAGVAIAKITKLLALLRPQLIPILDREVIGALYGRKWSGQANPDDFAEDVLHALGEFQRVLVYQSGPFDNLSVCTHIAASTTAGMRARGLPEPIGAGITPVRVLEQLIWFDWWGFDMFGYHFDATANAVVVDPSGRSGPTPNFADLNTKPPARPDAPACAEAEYDETDEYDESKPLPAGWWSALCRELRRLQASPGYVETASQGVPNDILVVDEAREFVRLRSRRSKNGNHRDITRDMIEWPDNTHGVIRRDLRALASRLGRWSPPRS